MPERDKPLRKLNAAGQSVWCDHIHRGMGDGDGRGSGRGPSYLIDIKLKISRVWGQYLA